MDFEQITPDQLGASGISATTRDASSAVQRRNEPLVVFVKIGSKLVLAVLWLLVELLGRPFVFLINLFLNNWAPNYQYHFQLKGLSEVGGDVATDGVSPPGMAVETTLYHSRYGTRKNETVDTMFPHDRALADANPAIVYVHGGGWIAANSACLLHSVAPIARAGYDLYSIDYPLAPEVRFPGPLVSTIRAISWIKTHEGKHEILLLGDSAGGNLVSTAAALIMNREIFEVFAREAKEPALLTMEFPKIIAVSSIYGIMDQREWRASNLDTISWLENKISQFCISFAFRMYRCTNGTFGNKFTLMDILDHVTHLPPIQLQCGSKDVLVLSNRKMHKELLEREHHVEHKEYPSRHCFFGFPPKWLSNEDWHNGSKQVLTEMLRFFAEHVHAHKKNQ
eukprot:CAMPEP_0203748956 /NCGR_PEP_ID=MMETSP0098-20131031/3692_1 /ASSEMBLY_ACC=CAM_ASM_000208 /TAXON_ID=96639 /ORGANISM=" , Strain NY0313808BC1" /LENGTH=394 /DNA_ID=CAMNT_0050637883 /DNA_START=300 /DNA_END=1484 /DNA_ORIENTATION=+